MGTESPEKEPQLPENTTAQQLLDEYSEKARAEIAQAQGISAVAFNRYLNTQVRRERVAASVSQAKEILQGKPETSERNEHYVLAELAVIRGLKEALQKFSPEHLSEEAIDVLEQQAYAAVEEFGAMQLGYEHTMKGEKIERMFERIVIARAQNEINKHTTKGKDGTAARKAVVTSLREQEKRTNLAVLRNALRGAAWKFEMENIPWKGPGTREIPELQSIIDGYGKRPLTTRESELLAAFLKASKAYYFSNAYPDSSSVLERYRPMLDIIFSAYKNHGPHKRTMANVSGPAEAFTSHQSERESGYRRVGKARPHRDPSGGSGENW